MDDEQAVAVFKAYKEEFKGKLWWEPECHDLEVHGLVDSTMALQHASWMCDEALQYAETDPKRLHRWLGFVQCILWYVGFYSIEQLANHNRLGEGSEAEQPESEGTVLALLVAELESDMKDCIACSDDEPCQACLQNARVLGSIEGLKQRSRA